MLNSLVYLVKPLSIKLKLEETSEVQTRIGAADSHCRIFVDYCSSGNQTNLDTLPFNMISPQPESGRDNHIRLSDKWYTSHCIQRHFGLRLLTPLRNLFHSNFPFANWSGDARLTSFSFKPSFQHVFTCKQIWDLDQTMLIRLTEIGRA